MISKPDFKKVPALRFLLPFICGIVSGNVIVISKPLLINGLLVICILSLFVLGTIKALNTFENSWIYGLCINSIIFILGIILLNQKYIEPNYLKFQDKKSIVSAYILEVPEKNADYIKTTININAIKTNTGWKKIRGKALVYFQYNKNACKLNAGDHIVFYSTLNEVKNAGNPNEFDYHKYLYTKGIYSNLFLHPEEWIATGKNYTTIQVIANKMQSRLLSIYKENGVSDKEFGVIAALTLGYRNKIDTELKEKYAYSGVLHILAVSGLHVGIIYLAFNFLLGFLNHKNKGKVIKAFILLTVLWVYALLTGMSSSVVRASIMFTFISLGNTGRKDINLYNILAFSALVVLLCNPLHVFEVGFQLSYIAVLGIVFFQPRIYKLLHIKSRILNTIWKLFTVSLAAQIVTFPLTLFYFHYFPTYFWLTNLFVIPFATIIICLAIMLLACSFSQVLIKILIWSITSMVKLLNGTITTIYHLPFSFIKDISISPTEVLLLYFLIVSFTAFILMKKKKWLFSALATIVLLLCTELYYDYTILQNSSMTVYNVKGLSVYQYFDGKSSILITDSKSKKDYAKIKYAIKNNQIAHRVKSTGYLIKTDKGIDSIGEISERCNIRIVHSALIIQYNANRTVFLCNDTILNTLPKSKLSIDYLVLNNNICSDIRKVYEYFNPQKIIIDSSVPYWKARIWREGCKENSIPCYYAREKAFSCIL